MNHPQQIETASNVETSSNTEKTSNTFSSESTDNDNSIIKSESKERDQKKQILVLDGLRAIACLYVLFFHFRWLSAENISWYPTKGLMAYVTAFFVFGNSGVILFFLLSGFLLFLPFAKALLFKDSKWPSLRRFYLRRIFRIIPAYYVSLVLLILFSHPELIHLTQWRTILQFLTFRMNWEVAQQINGVFWTLAVEFQFYLLLPLIAWVISLIVRRGAAHWRFIKLVFCLSIMIGWGLIIRYWAIYIVDTPKLDWLIPRSFGFALKLLLYGEPRYIEEGGKYLEVFGLGMLVCTLYVYARNIPQARRWNYFTQLFSPFAAFLGLSSLAFLAIWNLYNRNLGAGSTLHYLINPYQKILTTLWPVGRPFLIGLAFALCMFALLHGPEWLKRPLEWNSLRWFGIISYSLYIWHLPLLFFYFGYFSLFLHNVSHIVQYIILCLWILIIVIPFSAMMYRYIEKPGIRLGEAILCRIEA